MYGVKNDGYLYDENMLMYPLQNIISIKWVKDARKICIDTIRYNDQFKIFFTDEEVNEFEEVQIDDCKSEHCDYQECEQSYDLTPCQEEFKMAQERYEDACKVMHEASERLTMAKRNLDDLMEMVNDGV